MQTELVPPPARLAMSWRAAGVLVLLLATVLVCVLAPVPRTTPPPVIMDLPYHVGPLFAFSQKISEAELEILSSDTFARKAYGAPDEDPSERILCSIVLAGNVPRSLHRPERCLPAQGYTIESSHVIEVPLKSGHRLAAQLLYLKHPWRLPDGSPVMVKSYFIYWFSTEGISTPDHFERVFLTNWDLLTRRVNDRWCYVYVHANILQGIKPGGRDAQQTLDTLKNFIRDSVPFFLKSEMPSATTADAPSTAAPSAGKI